MSATPEVSTRTTTDVRPPARMAAQDPGRSDPLRLECVILHRYLTDSDPDAYAVRKYVEAHRHLAALRAESHDRIEGAILGMASRGGGFTEIADAYARIFRKGGLLRSKLMVLLAILESAPPTHREINTPVIAPRRTVVLSLVGWVCRGVVCAGAGVLLLGPVHLVLGIRTRLPRSRITQTAL